MSKRMRFMNKVNVKFFRQLAVPYGHDLNLIEHKYGFKQSNLTRTCVTRALHIMLI